MKKLLLAIIAMFLLTPALHAQTLSSDPNHYLSAWYKCIGDSSATAALPTTTTTVYDSSGFANVGTYVGTKAGSHSSTYYSAGTVGPNACYFDGSSNAINMGGTPAWNFGTGSFTVSFWMTPTAVPASSYVVPFSTSTTGNNSGVYCQVKFGDGLDYLYCGVEDTNSVVGAAGTTYGTIVSSQPYMVTVVMNRTANTWNLYLNGVLQASTSVTLTGSVNTSVATASNCLGANTCLYNRYHGTENDARIYKTALTGLQVAHLYAADLAQNSTPQVTGQLASLSVSGTSAYVVPTNFMGWSIEWTQIGTIMGQASTGTDNIIRQLATNLTSVSGGNLNIRVGGSSVDTQNTAYSIQPEIEFLTANAATEFILSIPAKNSTLPQQEAVATAYVGGIPSAVLEFGNEPDTYGISSATFLTNLGNFLSPVHTSYPSTLFVGPSCVTWYCSSWGIFNAFSTGAAYGLHTNTQHLYVLSSGTCASPYDCLLQPISGAYLASQPTWLATSAVSAHGSSYKFRVNEMNSIANGGQSGVSNTFSSALWLIANAMNMAQETVDGVNIHCGCETGDGTYYDQFYITVNSGSPNTFALASVKPVYYAMLFFDTATQNNAAIYPVTLTLNTPCSVSGWTGCLEAWETKDTSGVYRLSLVNLDEVHGGNVVVSNAAATASVCYLSAPSFTSTSGVTFAGQTFDGSTTGTIQGAASYTTLTPSGGVFTIPMAVTQAAIVRFGVSSGC